MHYYIHIGSLWFNGYIHMTTLITSLYKQLSGIYFTYNVMDIIIYLYLLHPLLIMSNRCTWSIYGTWLVRFTNILLWLLYAVSYFMQCTSGSSKALHINANHILYYHMDAYRSVMLRYSCFQKYLAIWLSTGGSEFCSYN